MSASAKKVAAAVEKYGEPMVLRRRVGTTTTYTSVSLKGLAANYSPAELVGGLQQGDRKATISNAEIMAQSAYQGPPRKGDFLVIDQVQTAVQGVEPHKLGSEVLAYTLWVRG